MELKIFTIMPAKRAIYAKLTDLITDFDISVRANIKGK